MINSKGNTSELSSGKISLFELPRNGWFFKYKLHHLPLWFVYHSLWWTISVGDPWKVLTLIFFSHSAIKFSFYLVFQALGVYFNLYFLIPGYLEKGQYVKYITLLLLTIGCSAACIVTGYYFSALLSDRTFQELWGVEPGNFMHFFNINALPSTVASMTLAMSIKLTKSWISVKRREQLLEKENLETELKFLRSQFNPHFLFNTINSIFVLIHKNQAMASEALAKFSDLLRYQLYECNEHKIPLRQEITYLQNFIELQKLRQDSNNLVLTVQLGEQSTPDLHIAPFVLIPFIENAFKHVSQLNDKPKWISVNLRHDHHQLYFSIANSISTQKVKSREFIQYNGIGLKNVQRRLDLLYPEQYKLNIVQSQEQFNVSLQLKLHEYNVSERVAVYAD